jgi:hypothetical protein
MTWPDAVPVSLQADSFNSSLGSAAFRFLSLDLRLGTSDLQIHRREHVDL